MKKFLFLLLLLLSTNPVFAATITAAAGGGNWSAGATWVGGVKPTTGDDVVLNASSGSVAVDENTVTLKSFDMTNYIGVLSGSNTITVIPSSGSTSCKIAGTINWTGQLVLGAGTGASLSLTSNGKTLNSININANASGDVYFLDAVTIGASATLQLSSGRLHTDGSSDNAGLVHTIGLFNSNNTATRTLNLGNSTITITGSNTTSVVVWNISNGANLTLTPGGSSLIFTGAQTTNMDYTFFYGGSKTYNSVSFTGPGVIVVGNSNTYTTFTRAPSVTNITDGVSFSGATTTVTGTIHLNGSSASSRLYVCSKDFPTAKTIVTTGATIDITSCDFEDITFNPAVDLSSTTGGCGICANTTGIVGSTVKTIYWVGNGGSWADATNHWSITSGGSPNIVNIPLPQDTCNFNINSFSSGSQTVSMNMARIGNVNWTGSTNSPTFVIANNFSIYGSFTLISQMTYTCSSKEIQFRGRTPCTLTSAGKKIMSGYSASIYGYMVGGSLTLQDNFREDSNVYWYNGTFDANDHDVDVNLFSIGSGTAARAIYMRSGTWSIRSSGDCWGWGMSATEGLTFDCGTSTLYLAGESSYNTGGFKGTNLTYYNVIIAGGGSGTCLISGNNTIINNLRINAPKTILATSGKQLTLLGSLTMSGTLDNIITISSTTPGNPFTFSKIAGIVNCDFLSLRDCAGIGGATWYAGSHSTNVSGNSGWLFTSPFDALLLGGD